MQALIEIDSDMGKENINYKIDKNKDSAGLLFILLTLIFFGIFVVARFFSVDLEYSFIVFVALAFIPISIILIPIYFLYIGFIKKWRQSYEIAIRNGFIFGVSQLGKEFRINFNDISNIEIEGKEEYGIIKKIFPFIAPGRFSINAFNFLLYSGRSWLSKEFIFLHILDKESKRFLIPVPRELLSDILSLFELNQSKSLNKNNFKLSKFKSKNILFIFLQILLAACGVFILFTAVVGSYPNFFSKHPKLISFGFFSLLGIVFFFTFLTALYFSLEAFKNKKTMLSGYVVEGKEAVFVGIFYFLLSLIPAYLFIRTIFAWIHFPY